MASKNMRSEGYTQFPDVASAPVSCSVLAGRAVSVSRGFEDRGIVEISRDVSREGWFGGNVACWGCAGEEEEKNGMRGR